MKKRILSVLGSGILAFGIAGSAEATPTITNGLVAAYEFIGNANDSSGNGLNGTVYGAILTTDRFNNINNAYSFYGNDYMDFGDNDDLNFGVNSFSVSFWLKAPIQDSAIISKTHEIPGPGTPGWNIQCENTGVHNIGVRLDLSDGNNFLKEGYTVSTGGEALDNNWHHIAMVVDRSHQLALAYLDGVTKQTVNISSIGSLSSNRELLMGWRGDWWYKLNGSLDDVYLYSRALSALEINSLYTGSAPVPEPATLLFFGTGIAGLAGMRLRKRRISHKDKSQEKDEKQKREHIF